MDCSTPGLPVHYHLPQSAQVHINRIGDVIQPSHPLSASSPFCLQSFPASGTFPMIPKIQQIFGLFALDDQNARDSASGPGLPVNIQG